MTGFIVVKAWIMQEECQNIILRQRHFFASGIRAFLLKMSKSKCATTKVQTATGLQKQLRFSPKTDKQCNALVRNKTSRTIVFLMRQSFTSHTSPK